MKTNDLVLLVRMMKKQMISQVSFNETNLLFYDNDIIHDTLVLLLKEKEMKAYSRKCIPTFFILYQMRQCHCHWNHYS